MELRHLKYFVAVAEEENVTRAAARLHVAQPSLSRQIRDLETELEVSLFERQAKSLRLTDAGRFFLEEARSVLELAQSAVQRVRDFSNGQEGELHVGYAPSLTTAILPDALRLFRNFCPRVRVHLHDLSTEEMLERLRTGELRVALLGKPSKTGLEGLAYREIRKLPVMVALSPSHPWAKERDLTPAQLVGAPWLAYAREDYPEYHLAVKNIFHGADSLSLSAEYDSSTSLIAAVESGGGFALVQEGFESLSGDRLAIVPLKHKTALFSFGSLSRKNDATSSTTRFIEALTTITAQSR